MKVSSLLKTLSIFAVAMSGKTAQAQFGGNITVCNNFPISTPENTTTVHIGQLHTVTIDPQTCLDIPSSGELYVKEDIQNLEAYVETETLNGVSGLAGKIETTPFGDMVFISQVGMNFNSYNCGYRTSKNQIDVYPPVNNECSFTPPNKDEDVKDNDDSNENEYKSPSLRN